MRKGVGKIAIPFWGTEGSYLSLRGWLLMCEVFWMISGALLVVKMGSTTFCVRNYDGEHKKGRIASK